MRLRADLMIQLQQALVAIEGTQREKADVLGISQPRLNDLLQGRIDKFSLDALVALVQAQGGEVEMTVRLAPQKRFAVHDSRLSYAARPKRSPPRKPRSRR
jgi:predicted XRE-type DNA-binding protein